MYVTKVVSICRSGNLSKQSRLKFGLKTSSSSSVLPVTVFVRSYARRTARRTAIEVEERTQTQTGTQQQTGLASRTQERPILEQQYEMAPGEDEGTTEGSLTPDIRRHMTKVYGTMTAGLGLAAVGSVIGGMMPGLAIVGMLGSIAGVIGLMFTNPEKVTFRQNLFLGIAGLTGLAIAPLVATSAPGVIFAAALGTSAIFGGFSLAALKAKRRSFLMLGGPLLGGLFMLVGCSIAGLLLPLVGVTSPAILGALYNLNLYGGLILFSIFISYDTQRMIEDYRAGDHDHVSPALNMFFNVINIFIRLLRIFRD